MHFMILLDMVKMRQYDIAKILFLRHYLIPPVKEPKFFSCNISIENAGRLFCGKYRILEIWHNKSFFSYSHGLVVGATTTRFRNFHIKQYHVLTIMSTQPSHLTHPFWQPYLSTIHITLNWLYPSVTQFD